MVALLSTPSLTDEIEKQTVDSESTFDSESTITVLIAEQMEVLRLGLSRFVESNPDFDLAGETAAAEDVVAMSDKLKPDVLLLDIHLTDNGNFKITQKVKTKSPDTQVLIYSDSEQIEDVRAALDTSVRGYLLKQASFDEIGHAIHQIRAGQDYISQDLANRLLESMQTGYAAIKAPNDRDLKPALTPREQEILPLVRSGLTNSEIAAELILAEKTIKHHLTSIYRKFNVQSRTQIICVINEQQLK